MTETELKLIDAKTQLSLAEEHIKNEVIVRSCINAFISLARSVTFVMQAESGDESTKLHQWYRAQMASMTAQQGMLRFFNERRVYSIHRGTVRLQPTTFAIFGPMLENGNAIFREQRAMGWLFDGTSDYGIPESTSALWLCTQYLKLLEELVGRWVRERCNG